MKIFLHLVATLLLTSAVFGQAPSIANLSSFPVYIKVELDKSIKLSALKPQDIVQGKLARDVYSADRKLLNAGSRVQLRVDHLKRQHKTANDHWPWIIRALAPRHETVPSFQEAMIASGDGEKPLHVTLISAAKTTEIGAEPTKEQQEDVAGKISKVDFGFNSLHRWFRRSHARTGQFIFLEAGHALADTPPSSDTMLSPVTPEGLPTGTACRVLLLNAISASKSHSGEPVQALLLEPVVLNSRVALPAGTLFEGNVVKTTPPRRLSRAGSLSITFTGVRLPHGEYAAASASLSGLEVDRRSHVKIDNEGHLHGDHPGTAWTLINGGLTAGIAKEVDDGTQLLLEAVLSGATDASTAGTARIAGAIVSGIFLATRHGRDVVLPNLTEMQIRLNRPLTLPDHPIGRAPNIRSQIDLAGSDKESATSRNSELPSIR